MTQNANAAADPKELHDATDRLNAAIWVVEDALRAVNPWCVATVVLSDGNIIGWTKVRGTWRLIVTTPGEPVPLVSAARTTRVLAVARFNDLLVAMRQAVADQLAAVNEATDVAQSFAADLRRAAQQAKK